MNEQEQNKREDDDACENGSGISPGAQQEQAMGSNHVAKHHSHHKQTRFGDIDLKDRLLIEITIGAVLIAVATCIVLMHQARLMDETLTEIRGGAQQTERLLRLYRAQVIKLGALTQATRDEVAETKRANRLWIFAEATFEFSKPKIKTYIDVRNASSSPATFQLGTPKIHLLPTNQVLAEMKRCSVEYPKGAGVGTLSPVSDAKNSSVALGTMVTPFEGSDYEDIQHGIKEFFVIGGVKYEGSNGGSYETRYCFMYLPTGDLHTGGCKYCNYTK